jgi:hypothetical protein
LKSDVESFREPQQRQDDYVVLGPFDDLTEVVRAVVLSGDRKRRHFCLELFGVITHIDP